MNTLQFIVAFVACLSSCLAVPPATSHQSVVSGDGYRYSYGIVHGPPGIGHAVGESYPHGYGGFGTYAPSYGYEGYGVSHGLGHDLTHLSHGLTHLSPALPGHAPIPVPVVTKPILPLPLEAHKPVAPLPLVPLDPHTPVISKPISIPFTEYVLSSPGHHHYGYGVPHYGEPHHGITHLETSAYDNHYSSLFDGYDGHLAYSSPVHAPWNYGYYKPSHHSYY